VRFEHGQQLAQFRSNGIVRNDQAPACTLNGASLHCGAHRGWNKRFNFLQA
jgi:hypothetical protein